jgi:hypothetical protein
MFKKKLGGRRHEQAVCEEKKCHARNFAMISYAKADSLLFCAWTFGRHERTPRAGCEFFAYCILRVCNAILNLALLTLVCEKTKPLSTLTNCIHGTTSRM